MKFLVDINDAGDIEAIARIGGETDNRGSNAGGTAEAGIAEESADRVIIEDAFRRMFADEGFDKYTADYFNNIHKMNNDLINAQHKLGRALRIASESEKEKAEFISRLSHDIKAPLGIITAMTDFAIENVDDQKKLLEKLQHIKLANEYLTNLINDMLELSRADNARMKLHLSPYMIDDFVNDVGTILMPLCEQRCIDIAILRGTILTDCIYADRIRLNQLVLNFLSNAVKYTPVGGKIEFEINVEQNRDSGGPLLKLRISDTGIGMSEEFQKKMFDPFSQENTNPLRESDVDSSGLGLSIAKKIIDLMGGTIKVQSAISQGTTVLLGIPLPALPQEETAAGGVNAGGAADFITAGTVILVDDNAINLEIGTAVLSAMGCSVTAVSSAEEAVHVFEQSEKGEISGIFMDIRMPVMNGFEAAQTIRGSAHPDSGTVVIIALSADAGDDARAEALKSGMNGCMSKPIDRDKVRAVIAEISDCRRPEKM
ncbi:MAG: ATP-binding protein [Eubacteriaceae bacterium]|nr:ATP-binding protein [Eubacteriaceae bacterium]